MSWFYSSLLKVYSFAVRDGANIVYIKFPDLQQLLEEAGYDLKNYVVEKNLLPE